jgi:uncharacterized protein
MPAASAIVQAIYRYPVKGLSADPLKSTALEVGGTVPADRLYAIENVDAIENGRSRFDPARPAHLPKICFLMLMRNERLAALDTHFDESSDVLSIGYNGAEACRGDLRTAEGRAAVEEFFARFCAKELRGPPKILHAPGHSFSDAAEKFVSIINLASVAAIETMLGVPIDPLRFRGNVYVEGWPAWHEFDLLNREIGIGRAAKLRISRRITRCAAIDVEPGTGIRDLSIPDTLMRTLDHADCGVYAEVVGAGSISIGDSIAVVES